jgi:hypothetical protein
MHKFFRLSVFPLAMSCVFQAHAAPPTSGAYITDPQSEYLQDQTSEGLKQPNSILCYMAATRPDAMVNKGTYVALIDESKCDTSSRDSASNSSSQGGGQASNFTSMRFTSTRDTNSSPQISKGHARIKMGDDNNPTPAIVYVHLSTTEGPSATAPNGALTMNLTGLATANNAKVMRGKIVTSGANLTFAWAVSDGAGSENYRLYVDGNDSAGSGSIVFADRQNPGQNITINFGYNQSYFCRQKVGGLEKCFSRSKEDAAFSVWRYGVYDDNTGARYDLAVPGFPVKNANGQFGFASYWGTWFATPLAVGETAITSQNGQTSYTALKTSGRLVKYSKQSKTLNQLQKVPFQFWSSASIGSIANQNAPTNQNYEAFWNGSAFVVTSTNSCSQSGCFKTKLDADVSLTAQQLLAKTGNMGVSGWSEALGGQLQISPTALQSQTPGTETATFNTQETVKPSDTVPTSLKCVRNCPTDALLNAPVNGNPFLNSTWGATQAADVVTYTWDANAYAIKDNTGTALRNSRLSTNIGQQYGGSGGVRSGNLVDANNLSDLLCPASQNTYCDWKASALDTYYVWENGNNDWNSATFLRKVDNTYVNFTAPQSASFTVPNDATLYGQYAGANMNLQFGGFGNLWGIPGKCFDPQTNQEASCGPSTRYVPAFSIPENTASASDGKVIIDNATKWVKFLDREIRFKRDGAITSAGQNITLGSDNNLPAALSLTSADSEDPAESTNTNFAGSVQDSDFNVAPKVIHGVVQP